MDATEHLNSFPTFAPSQSITLPTSVNPCSQSFSKCVTHAHGREYMLIADENGSVCVYEASVPNKCIVALQIFQIADDTQISGAPRDVPRDLNHTLSTSAGRKWNDGVYCQKASFLLPPHTFAPSPDIAGVAVEVPSRSAETSQRASTSSKQTIAQPTSARPTSPPTSRPTSAKSRDKEKTTGSEDAASKTAEQTVRCFTLPPNRWSQDEINRGLLVCLSGTAVAVEPACLGAGAGEAGAKGKPTAKLAAIHPTTVVRILHVPFEVLQHGGHYCCFDISRNEAFPRYARSSAFDFDSDAPDHKITKGTSPGRQGMEYIPPIRWLGFFTLESGKQCIGYEVSMDCRYIMCRLPDKIGLHVLHPLVITPPPPAPPIDEKAIMISQLMGGDAKQDAMPAITWEESTPNSVPCAIPAAYPAAVTEAVTPSTAVSLYAQPLFLVKRLQSAPLPEYDAGTDPDGADEASIPGSRVSRLHRASAATTRAPSVVLSPKTQKSPSRRSRSPRAQKHPATRAKPVAQASPPPGTDGIPVTVGFLVAWTGIRGCRKIYRYSLSTLENITRFQQGYHTVDTVIKAVHATELFDPMRSWSVFPNAGSLHQQARIPGFPALDSGRSTIATSHDNGDLQLWTVVDAPSHASASDSPQPGALTPLQRLGGMSLKALSTESTCPVFVNGGGAVCMAHTDGRVYFARTCISSTAKAPTGVKVARSKTFGLIDGEIAAPRDGVAKGPTIKLDSFFAVRRDTALPCKLLLTVPGSTCVLSRHADHAGDVVLVLDWAAGSLLGNFRVQAGAALHASPSSITAVHFDGPTLQVQSFLVEPFLLACPVTNLLHQRLPFQDGLVDRLTFVRMLVPLPVKHTTFSLAPGAVAAAAEGILTSLAKTTSMPRTGLDPTRIFDQAYEAMETYKPSDVFSDDLTTNGQPTWMKYSLRTSEYDALGLFASRIADDADDRAKRIAALVASMR